MQTALTAIAQTAAPDPQLWAKARARAKFKSHLVVYLLVNTGLWVMYFLTGGNGRAEANELPWPVWTNIFWGLGLAIQGFGAYTFLNRGDATQREYDRLLRQQAGW